jgi:hypothetical protein
MAKKKLSRGELKRQRQQELERIRSKREWEPPEPFDLYPEVDHELVEDMRPLIGISPSPTQKELQTMMAIVLESSKWIEEPEFEDVILDPMASVELFIEAAEDRGFTLEAIEELDEDERIELQLVIVDDIADELLIPESLQEVGDALDELRARMKRQGKRQHVAEVAMLQSFLQYPQESAALGPIGLIHALVMKSIAAGFEMWAASGEILESLEEEFAEEKQRGGIWPLAERLNRIGAVAKVADTVSKIPGLSSFLSKKADDMWDKGLSRLFEGDLFLGLYSDEELSGAAAILESFITDAMRAEGHVDSMPQTSGEEMIEQLIQYISDLMTPERFDQLRAAVRKLLRDEPDLSPEEEFFLNLANNYLAEDDAVQNEIPFLLNALLGELRQKMTAASLEEE